MVIPLEGQEGVVNKDKSTRENVDSLPAGGSSKHILKDLNKFSAWL